MTEEAASSEARLVAMKRIALGLLAAAAVLYAIASALRPRHAAFGYVAAFAEAAMVGAIADWFAVVALFRHPLGLPIPHTAIIPTNKSRIGANLAGFICHNFLGTEQVLRKLRSFDPARRLAQWLAQPLHARQLGRHLVSAARIGLDAFDDERVRHFMHGLVVARLEQLDVARVAGEVLDALTADRKHQALLDEVLLQVAAVLADAQVRTRIAGVIADELRLLRYVGLDEIAGKLVTEKMIASVGRIIVEMADEPEHPLRLRFDEFMANFIARLKDDPGFRLRGETIKREVLAQPALAGYLHRLWSELLVWLKHDLARDDSSIAARIADMARTLGAKLEADEPMRQWINDQVVVAAPRWIERYRGDIGSYITARVDEWNTAEMTNELERNIGRDLQFVRINGTLVGGLVGLVIHALTVWLGG
jgi:uncharacterized membrane-anchored protein YjiN (DUF445 family)